ncbi:zinc ribbon domain-containing protein [Pseudomonas aeruginosa]|uniref:zinc-ribbon domain-containing protein n=1 Tax=Pseudomonas aeruginosa TaxID=287 RepID=UPI00125CF683
MALIKCKECGAQVSNKAKACPSCGAKVPKSVGVIGWLFVIFIVLPIAWQFGTGIGSSGDAAQSRPSSSQSAATSTTKSPWERHSIRSESKISFSSLAASVRVPVRNAGR